MGMILDLKIVGVGLYCPVGLTAQTACAALRAGVAHFKELDYVDERGEPIYGARVSVIEESLAGRRCAAMLSGALKNLLQSVDPQLVSRCPAILVTRPTRGSDSQLSPGERAMIEVMPSPPLVVRGGPGMDLQALAQAAELLRADRAKQVLVCAVDSRIDARALHDLREAGRLRSSSNPHGVLPGEAAACMLVELGSADGMSVVSLGLAHEPATLSNDAPRA